jgi:hypothetical protein
MPNLKERGRLTVDDLTSAVRQLSATELRRFTRWLVEWRDQDGNPVVKEATLIRIAKACLPPDHERRLKRLISKSERETLTAAEWQEYQTLAREAEQLDCRRAAALAELVRRRGRTVRTVWQEMH